MAFPEDRPGSYDPDLYWDEVNGVWSSTRVTVPGAWSQSVVVVSEEGEIYFGTV
jgi:hypothetical protein